MLFKKGENFEVIIGEHSSVKGDIETEGSVCINGKVYGNINTNGLVIISESALIEGDIISDSADIYGRCVGNVETKGPLTLYSDASVKGDVACGSITTTPGSEFDGKLSVMPRHHMPRKNDTSRSKSKNNMNSSKSNEKQSDGKPLGVPTKKYDKYSASSMMSKPDKINKPEKRNFDNKNSDSKSK